MKIPKFVYEMIEGLPYSSEALLVETDFNFHVEFKANKRKERAKEMRGANFISHADKETKDYLMRKLQKYFIEIRTS